MTKLTLPFVNGGKEFELPKMTVALHEEAMESMVEYGKLPEEKFNRLFNKVLIQKSLQKIDKSVSL